jgi:hypothetical protein
MLQSRIKTAVVPKGFGHRVVTYYVYLNDTCVFTTWHPQFAKRLLCPETAYKLDITTTGNVIYFVPAPTGSTTMWAYTFEGDLGQFPVNQLAQYARYTFSPDKYPATPPSTAAIFPVDPLNCILPYTDNNHRHHTWVQVTSNYIDNNLAQGYALTISKWGRDGIYSDPDKKHTITAFLPTYAEAVRYVNYCNAAILANPMLLVPCN